MAAARSFSNTDTILWRQVWLCELTLNLSHRVLRLPFFFLAHHIFAKDNFILILHAAVRKYIHGNCHGTTINIVSKRPSYSNHNHPWYNDGTELRIFLNLRQFPNPLFGLLFWAGCQANESLKTGFQTRVGFGSDSLFSIVLNKLDMWRISEVASKNWIS